MEIFIADKAKNVITNSAPPVRFGFGREECRMIKVPATTLTLLENIKKALSKNLLLTDDFYTDDNLKRFTGGAQISRVGENRENVKRVEITRFGAMVKTSWDGRRDEGGLTILCRKEEQFGGDVEGRLNLWLRNEDERVSYRNMEKLFGQQWEKSTARNGEKCLPPLHEHGNAEMEFFALTNGVEQTVRLLFSPRANLEMASFLEVRPFDL
ncbi:hypothetical protein QN379_14500 [Glaciimonas sp. Gout2]|uniref:hypothetical protein n=1 Tax=unclassified Glaciimonas TaxID=2644401 RepID=UPI002B23C8BE|nr:MULTISPECIES: hypothetical protein [unclassified Glaciimonas]MEB0013583.1 hypothetical protein [Glaciimonas sp. Cout2]MEB0083216.1 hypothetical protein [Glaciimonas sp. Gout2]